MKKTAVKQSLDLYQEVTNRIIEKLEEGVIPWKKTWSSFGLARNYVSGNCYKGINMFLMNFLSPHSIPYYLTFKQAKELGGKVKKGSKSQRVIFYNMIFTDKNGKRVSAKVADGRDDITVMKFMKYYNVFNVTDVEGIDFQYDEITLNDNDVIEACENVINSYPECPSLLDADIARAYYDPVNDTINVPPIVYHDSSESYYSTVFHELIHSTGHEKRLAREEVVTPNKFGSSPYSEEELVAELGASFLCHRVGVTTDELFDNSAAYIQGWLKKLKDDKKFIFKASANAQKAADYIMSDK